MGKHDNRRSLKMRRRTRQAKFKARQKRHHAEKTRPAAPGAQPEGRTPVAE